MLKEKWRRPTLAAFIMWAMRKAGLFVQTADGQGYVISPKFIQTGIFYAISTYTTTEFPVVFDNVPAVLTSRVGRDGTSENIGAVRIGSVSTEGVELAITGVTASTPRQARWLAIDLSFVFGKQMFGGGAS